MRISVSPYRQCFFSFIFALFTRNSRDIYVSNVEPYLYTPFIFFYFLESFVIEIEKRL